MKADRVTMKPLAQRLIWWMGLAGLLSVALLLVGFGHRSVQAEPQAVAYLLAGGDWADLCADGPAPHSAGDICAACVLGKGVALCAPALASQPLLTGQPAAWALPAATREDLTRATTYSARAPPAL